MNEMNHIKFMTQALAQAEMAKSEGELPFGAVVVMDERAIARAHCQESALHSVLAHAEAMAIDNACRSLKSNMLENCTIYCTSEPCPMCAAAIFQAKVSSVVIGASRNDMPFLRKREIDIEALAADSGYPIHIRRDVMKRDVLNLFGVV